MMRACERRKVLLVRCWVGGVPKAAARAALDEDYDELMVMIGSRVLGSI
jgi:hypothetical protein